MKKNTFYALLYFAIIVAIAAFSSCTSHKTTIVRNTIDPQHCPDFNKSKSNYRVTENYLWR